MAGAERCKKEARAVSKNGLGHTVQKGVGTVSKVEHQRANGGALRGRAGLQTGQPEAVGIWGCNRQVCPRKGERAGAAYTESFEAPPLGCLHLGAITNLALEQMDPVLYCTV